MAQKSKRTNFDNVLQMIRENPETVFKHCARTLSDLSAEKTAKLHTVLAELTPEHRAAFYNAMRETHLDEFAYDFTAIANLGFRDPDGEIRAASIEVLSLENSRETGMKILEAARCDPSEKAQIAAIDVLGQYMIEDDLEEPIPVNRKKLREVLEALIEDKTPSVRRAAVIAYAISESKRVNEIIRGYFAGNDREELSAALRAVSVAINKDFTEPVLELLNHDDEEIVINALNAAASLQLKEALPAVYELISRFDRISPDLLLAAVNAAAEIGDESGMDVLETLGEAAIDMDDEITDAIDDAIDTLNMTLYMGIYDDHEDRKENEHPAARRSELMLQEAIERSKDHCLSILEEKIPHDLEDDEPLDTEEEDDECDCGEHHHHHHHGHHHDNPLEGLDLSRFRILDNLEDYESLAHHDADEEELWAEFEEMAEEDLDAESLQDFINKLEAKQKKK